MPFDSSYAISEKVFTREELGLPPRGFVFCCFNNSFKLTPVMFDRWMSILARTEGAVLWLSRANAEAAANLRAEASRRGIDERRLIFAERMDSLPEHLSRLRAADLFLDTFPYNAHATAVDALWAGLPGANVCRRGFCEPCGCESIALDGFARTYRRISLGVRRAGREPRRRPLRSWAATQAARTKTHNSTAIRYAALPSGSRGRI